MGRLGEVCSRQTNFICQHVTLYFCFTGGIAVQIVAFSDVLIVGEFLASKTRALIVVDPTDKETNVNVRCGRNEAIQRYTYNI